MAGEFDLIARYFRPLAGPVGLGLADDAACLQPEAGQDLIVTKDMLVEGVHFFGDELAASIARKCLAVNLSDLAAKGATPLYYWLALSLPKGKSGDWLAGFSMGLREEQTLHGLYLAGGDTTASPGGLVISITAMGSVPSGTMIRRDGALPGDAIYVTGTLGDASLGLKCLEGDLAMAPDLVDRYHHPQPRVGFGQAARGLVTAGADVSDGLLADLAHICSASGVGANILQAALPLSSSAKAAVTEDLSLWPSIYAGGDDYELLLTVPEESSGALEQAAAESGVSVSRIGVVDSTTGIRLVDPDGQLLQTKHSGFQHF